MTKMPSRLLYKGIDHDEVMIVEAKLQSLGFFKGNPDTYFDEKTEEAVKAFQQWANITVDGVVGPETWNALFSGAMVKKGPEPIKIDKRKVLIAIGIIALIILGGRGGT